MTEYEVLEHVFDSLDESNPVDLYRAGQNHTRPEMYIKLHGECWRISAERHHHPLESTQ